MITAKDLTKEAPRNARIRLGGYVILARAIDKGRAFLNNTIGEYNFDCPLDNIFLGFKELSGQDLLARIKSGASDEEILAWVNANGASKTDEEIKAWSDSTEALSFYNIPEKKEWFIEACNSVGLNPETATLFDFLEEDDRVSYQS